MTFQYLLKPALAALTSAALTASLSAQEPAPMPGPEEIQHLLDAADVPGAAIAVIEDCSVKQVLSVGDADVEAAAPVTAHTAFEAASLSKPVFAWLVLSLVDDGLVDLDRPIALDMDYPRIANQQAYARITPRMILSHRTGLPNWVGEDVDFYDRTTPIASQMKPDEGFSYSGEAFQLLQAFVEQQVGLSIEELFRQKLGDVMPHSSWVLPLREGVTPSRGYHVASDPDTSRPIGDGDNAFERGLAAGSLITTAPDYGAFLSQVCARKGLAAETYDLMFAPVTQVPGEDGRPPSAFALGWNVQPMGNATLIGHDGNNDEYRTIAGFLPELRQGIVILTNGANGFQVIEPILGPPPGAQ